MVQTLPCQGLSCHTSVPRQSHPPQTKEQGDANASYNSSDSDDNAQDNDNDNDNDNDDDDHDDHGLNTREAVLQLVVTTLSGTK